MMEEWKEYKLKDLTTIINRGIAPKYVEVDGHYVINQKCIRDNILSFTEARLTDNSKRITKSKKVNLGDVLVNSTGTGTLGRTALVKKLPDGITTVDTHVTIVRPNDLVDERFLGYNLSFQEPQIVNYGKGATNQQELGRDDLGLLKVELPSLPIQRKIASILSSYDDLIENNLQRIKLLEEMAQNTYEEWFVRMNFPGHESVEWDEETGLPEGWENGQIGQVIDFVNGYAFKSKDFQEVGNSVIKIKNIGNNTIDIFNTDCVDNSVKVPKKFKLVEGDLLIAMTGATIGKVGFIPKNNKTIYLNQRVGKFQKKGEVNNTAFIACIFNSELGVQQILNYASGAAQPNISGNDILSIKSIIPTEDLLKMFAEKVNPMFEVTLKLYYQNQHLKEARDILLPRLMTGMIEV